MPHLTYAEQLVLTCGVSFALSSNVVLALVFMGGCATSPPDTPTAAATKAPPAVTPPPSFDSADAVFVKFRADQPQTATLDWLPA